MKNIIIIVATHKKYQMPEDQMYFPVQVGAEGKTKIEEYTEEELRPFFERAFEEEILRNIRRRLVIPDPVPIDRTGKLVCRFKTSGSEVFQEDVIHFAIGADHKADDHFVAATARFIRGDRTKLPLSPVIGFYEKQLFYVQDAFLFFLPR